MNRQQLLLLKLNEECVEVAKECSKAIQFGMDEVYPPIGLTNRDRIRAELQDLYAVVQILNNECGLDFVPSPEAVEIKLHKINHYAEYSQQLGCVENERI